MSDQPSRTLFCWPGLAGLWQRGHWPSLVLAVAFSLVLNLALVSTFVWPGMLNSVLIWAIWPIVLTVWFVFGWISWRRSQTEPDAAEWSDEIDATLFIQAQTEYLTGEYSQAELLLHQQLKAYPRDAEARLLLASLYRRTLRAENAAEQLESLQKLDERRPWGFEIQREWALVNDQLGEADEEKAGQDASLKNTESSNESNKLDASHEAEESLIYQDDLPSDDPPEQIVRKAA